MEGGEADGRSCVIGGLLGKEPLMDVKIRRDGKDYVRLVFNPGRERRRVEAVGTASGAVSLSGQNPMGASVPTKIE